MSMDAERIVFRKQTNIDIIICVWHTRRKYESRACTCIRHIVYDNRTIIKTGLSEPDKSKGRC